MGGRPLRCLTGEVFERLTVLEETGDVGRRGKHYLCRCDCGNTTLAWHDSLVRSEKISCGCLFRDSVEKSKEDGRNNRNSRHPLYDRFRKMISRCYNPKDGSTKVMVPKAFKYVTNGWDQKVSQLFF